MSDATTSCEWEWEGRRYTFTSIGDADVEVSRVYAVAITDDLEIVLVQGPWAEAGLRLPGGGIEAGEGTIEALARELREEAGAVLQSAERLGVQRVASPGRPDEFQAFYRCRVALGDFEPSDEAEARHLVSPFEFLDRLHWGRDDPKAELLLDAALDAENRRRRWLVVPPRARWATEFEQERERLARAFEGCHAVIEHVGSTAVPELAAKPILDILIGVVDLREVEARIGPLERLGYRYVPEYEEQLPQRRYFRKPGERPSSHHLHVVVEGTRFWDDHLLFRDTLRRDRAAAAKYAALKRRGSIACARDGTDYTAAKATFIRDLLRRERDGGAAILDGAYESETSRRPDRERRASRRPGSS